MINNEEIIQILKDNSEHGTIGWTVEEAMFEDVAKQIQCKVQNLNIDIVSVSLLKKYMNHVRDCEGIDFTDRLNERTSEQIFTEEEVNILEKTSNER